MAARKTLSLSLAKLDPNCLISFPNFDHPTERPHISPKTSVDTVTRKFCTNTQILNISTYSAPASAAMDNDLSNLELTAQVQGEVFDDLIQRLTTLDNNNRFVAKELVDSLQSARFVREELMRTLAQTRELYVKLSLTLDQQPGAVAVSPPTLMIAKRPPI